MAGNFQPPPRTKNGLDEYKLRLSAPPTQGATKPASLAFSLVANNPRIDVYTNVPNDRNNGNIRAALDHPTWWAVIVLLKQAIAAEPGFKRAVPCKNYTWYENKRSDEPKLICNIVIGKDNEGRVFISLMAKDRPVIKFVFLPSIFHGINHADGSPFSEAELSVVYATGYAEELPKLYAAVADTHYQEPKPKDGGGGNQGGGSYNRGGGGGGGQNYNRGGGNQNQQQSSGASNDFDDDFPM